jgi:NADH-quinone oxidoreductase subunit J
MCLIGTMVSLAGIYSLLQSPFLATLQILVYAGAIMMLLVFVIMVLNSAKDTKIPRMDLLGWMAGIPAILVGAALIRLLLSRPGVDQVPHLLGALPGASETPSRGTVEVVSSLLYGARSGAWPLMFLAVGLLLLTAIVGAVLLAKRRLDVSGDHATSPTGGH